MRGKEGNSSNPTKFLPPHFVKLAALVSLVKDDYFLNFGVTDSMIHARRKTSLKASHKGGFIYMPAAP